MDQAFAALRWYARDRNLTLHSVALGITTRTIPIEDVSESLSHR
jgi:hypothetical protein